MANTSEEQAELWKTLARQSLAAAAAMGGAGVGLRGLTGLLGTIRGNFVQPPRSAYAPIAIDMPILPSTKKKRQADIKTAQQQGLLGATADQFPAVGELAIKSWVAPFSAAAKPVLDVLGNVHAKNTMEMPAGLPAVMLSGLGGGYGGWALTDYLLDKRRKKLLRQEVDDAKQQFEQALVGKSAVAKDLDELCDLAEKTANDSFWQGMGTVGGVGLTTAAIMALLAGQVGYQNAQKRDAANVVEKAREQHARALQAARPVAVFARPVESEYL
jgi:hypothetical protein